VEVVVVDAVVEGEGEVEAVAVVVVVDVEHANDDFDNTYIFLPLGLLQLFVLFIGFSLLCLMH
jgi:hypothetical protein